MRTGRLAAAGAAAGGSRWLRHIAYGFDDHDKRAYPELAATNERIHERTSENVRVLSVRKLLLVDERPNCDDDWRRRTTGDDDERNDDERKNDVTRCTRASERERREKRSKRAPPNVLLVSRRISNKRCISFFCHVLSFAFVVNYLNPISPR